MADNYLTYPVKNMTISQSYKGSYSHSSHTTGNYVDYPWDEAGGGSGRDYMYCPADKMVVKRIYGVGNGGANTIWLESTEKVKFADGTEDYVTLLITHPEDDDLSKISVGQVFNRGDIICREGTDGLATGNHFHFSVGKGKMTNNGWVQNSNGKWVLTTTGGTYPPEKLFYVDSSFTTISSSNGLSFKTIDGKYVGNVAQSPEDVVYDYSNNFDTSSMNSERETPSITYESKVVPRRVNDSGHQPQLAFVDLYVGGRYLTFMPPQYTVSLEVNKFGDHVMSFILTVFDKDWDTLEELFSNVSDLKLKYGLVGGKESKTFNLSLTDYDINFNTAGTLLSIRGNSTGVVDNMTRITLDTKTTNPTESAKTVCRSQGWIVLDQNFEPSQDVTLSTQDTLALINDYPITYIKHHLAPIAVRKSDGETGYMFYLDDTTTPPTAYFGVHEITENAHKTYVYMRGIDSPVIDLNLSMQGVFGGVENGVTTEIEASFIDPETKEQITLSENINSIRKSVTGEFTHTKSTQSKKVVDAAGATRSQMNAIVNYRLSTSMPYTGTLKIVGDPEININDIIRLIIITDKGNLHHSSGLYLVLEASDAIYDGSLVTSLRIVRQEDIEHGLEIVNYRTLLK